MQKCFDLRLSEPSRELIEHLDHYGRFRYLEISYHVLGRERFDLDRTVWEVRRYCRAFDEDKNVREQQLKEIESDRRPPNKCKLQGGLLEKILTEVEGKHPARPALIYQNHFFGTRSRKRVRIGGMHAENAPLWLYPKMLGEVRKYAYLPKPVIDAYKEALTSRVKEGTVRTLLP